MTNTLYHIFGSVKTVTRGIFSETGNFGKMPRTCRKAMEKKNKKICGK